MAKNTPASPREKTHEAHESHEREMYEAREVRDEGDAEGLPAIDGLKFEAALAELEQLVRRMEDERLPLEDSIAAYRRGSALLARCQHLLQDAEQKIQILENGALRDFDARGDAQ